MKLDYNFLQSLPHGLNKLVSLQILSASQNNLKSIPSNLYLLTDSLRHLILHDNKLCEVQAKIGNLLNL